MIEVRRDWDLLVEATEQARQYNSIEELKIWYDRPENIQLIEGDNVGIASYQNVGLYCVHWYYQSARGRTAINLGKAMCKMMFTDFGAITLVGIIKKELRHSAWACRQLGFKSLGYLTYEDGDINEMFFATKDEFLKGLDNG